MPFDVDDANPQDDAIVSQFPANERASRSQIDGWMDFEHEATTGRHKIPAGSVATRDSFSDWSLGSLWINTDITPNQLQAQVGTPPTFSWTDVGLMPSGSVIDFAGTTAPSGWLLCYGQAISRTTYAALFAAIGTTYGVGDGSTTFNLPDLRGRVVAGKDDMGGVSANRITDQGDSLNGDVLGDAGGTEVHQLTVAQLPIHTPTGSVTPALILSQAAAAVGYEGGPQQAVNLNASAATSVTMNAIGGDVPHNNIQPTIILNKIIKT